MNIKNSAFLKELIFISTFLTTLFVSAQSKPGNTSLDVELWLKADQISQTNETNVTTWTDQSGNNRNFSQNGTNSVPTFVLNGMNFNPTLNFGTDSYTKLVGPVNINNTLKEYYVYIVSYNRSKSWAMMLTFNQQRNNGYGWASTVTSPWQYTGGANRVATNGANKLYNLSSAYVPNIGNSSAYQYVNGIETIFGANTSQAFPTSTTNRMIIGATDLGASYNFTGDISEIIVLSRNRIGSPDYTELSKVNSYLALKYGITLPTNNQVNYFNSSEQVIWDRSNNIGFENHIFGLGRDDASSLNIKQAKSYSNDDIVLYLNSLQDLNKENSSVIATNNSYLLLGSNDLASTTFYKHGVGTAFNGGDVILQNPIYKRFNRIYKVSNINFTNNINIKLNNQLTNASHLLVSNNTSFTPLNTRIYPINNGVIENINLSNNEYISFVSTEKAPGGTDLTVELWLNSNSINSSDNSNITAWNDESYFQRNFIQNGTNPVPMMNYNGLNFNPSLNIKNLSNNTKLIGPANIIDPNKEYYFVYVSEISNTNNAYNAIFALNGSGYSGRFGWNSGHPWFYDTTNRNYTPFSGKRYGINITYVPNRTTSVSTFNTNGKSFNIPSGNTTLPISTTNLMVVGNGSTTSLTPFYGDINEIIILSKDKETNSGIDNNQIQRINSYLALKYGITLDTTEQPIYYNSENNPIWGGVGRDNNGFQNSIFGIGRDDLSGLHQKQSTSRETNAFTLFVGDLKDLNKNNITEIVNDKSFIIAGSNNENGTTLYDPIGTYANGTTINSSDLSRRYNRLLKINKTGTIGPVNLKVSNQFSYAPYIIVSNSTNFIKSDTRIYPVINGVAQGITLNDNDFIGFLSPKLIPGGTALETELWLRADFLSGNDNQNIDNWYDISNYSRNVSQYDTNDTPLFLNSSLNYNPTLKFESTPNTTKLVGDKFTESNKAYYVFYVAENNNTNSSTYGATFSFMGNQNNWSTGIVGTNNWVRTNVDLYPNNSNYSTPNNKNYMVTAVYFPNTTDNNRSKTTFFTNGYQRITTTNNTTFNTNGLKTVIGAQQIGGDYPFIGNISEIIVLSALNNTDISTTQVQQVNSYLALKYGITLDLTDLPNYYNTAGDIIWNSNSNSEYKNDIFGIGRDDATGFYQKQATSSNQNSVTVYLNDLKESNTENNAIINDNLSYLILGSNDAQEVINYNNTGLNSEKILQRFARTLKVSKTGNGINVVNLKLDNELYYSSYILVSSNANFPTSSTRLYSVNNGIAENIQLNHDDYISFIPEDFTPGGLEGFKREFWLAADQINTANLDSVSRNISTYPFVFKWNNRANNSNNFNFTTEDAIAPTLNKTSMNFRSSVEFNFVDTISIDSLSVVTVTPDQNRKSKLISEKDFIPESDRSYFTITISRLDPIATNYNTGSQNNNFYKSVFTLNTNDNFGWYGNQSTTQLWLGSNTQTIPNDKRIYGITINMLPNNTSLNRKLYFNGTSDNFTAATLSTTSSKSVIGNNAITGSSDKFFGEILEILVLSKNGAGNYLTDLEIEKLNTYYSLKYGISLNNTKYTLSNGSVVYDTSTSGYSDYTNDIFGLVRDDQSKLYQKQALSEDNSVMTIYLGDLAETNDQNTSNELNDNEAIILGAKGTTKIRTYQVGSVSQFNDPTSNLDPSEKLSTRYEYTYKAKVTKGTTGTDPITVNLAPNIGQYILISQNETFPVNNNTRIYKIQNGEVKNVVIHDGDYIGFAFYMQAPGGVSTGLRMWLNASIENTISYNEKGQVLTWTDYSGFGTVYRRRDANNESAQYVKSDPRTNFHPTLVFDSSNDYLITNRGPMSVAGPDRTSFYTVINHNFARDRSYFLGFGSEVPGGSVSRRPVFGVLRSNNSGLGRIRSSAATNSDQNLFNPGATMIAGYHWKMADSIKFEFDAHIEQKRHRDNSAAMNGIGMLGAGSLTDSYLVGTLPEVAAYEFFDTDQESNLSYLERHKINSYLGLKYGITLDLDKSSTTINYDYTFSNNDIVWEGNNNIYQKFHNNVASIIRDDDAALLNKQSHSTDLNDAIYMGVGTSLGVNGVLGNITENYSALTWGNNGESFSIHSFGDDNTICGQMDSRINGKVWLVSPKNFNQEVILRTEKGSNFPFNGSNYQVYLLVADSPEKLITTSNNTPVNNWDQIIPMNFIDGEHQINIKFDPTKVTYFTFGAKAIQACASCEFKEVKTLQFTKQTWPIRGEKGPINIDLGNNFNVEVTVDDPGNDLKNRYPRYSSRKSLRERKRGGNTVTTSVKFYDDLEQPTTAVTSFNLLDIDRTGYTLSDVQVIGYCKGSEVYPNLYYTYKRPDRSRYMIKNNSIAEAKSPGTRYSGNSGYTNARGMAFVEFEYPVEEIKIIYKTPDIRNVFRTQEIGIGEMDFYCITPPPPPNEDGLIFTKQGTSEALLCETVDYTFRMMNTNCNEKEVTLVDQLPLGMEWDLNSIVVLDPNFTIPENSSDDPNDPNYFNPDTELYDNATVDIGQDGKQTLTITGLKVPGGGVTYSVRVSAVFAENATLTGIENPYLNQASIKYKRIVGENTTNAELLSTDRLTGNAFTSTIALYSDRPKRLQTEFTLDKSCFSLNKEIEATLKITNPNTDLDVSGLILDFGFPVDGGISYIPGSLVAEGITLVTGSGENTNNVDNYLDLSDLDGGNVSIENFAIAKNTTITIKLKFKTSGNYEDYIYPNITPSNPTPDPDDITFSYDLYSESDIECMDTTTTFTNGEIDLSFCDFCTQPPTGGIILSSDTGISTFKNKSSNWLTEVPNGFLVLESSKKGMVITRTKPEDIASPVKGMIIYNTVSKCISIYNGSQWKCIERACNE